MDFNWTDEQQRLRDAIVAFAERDLNDDVLRRDADHAFSRDAWERCARFGLQGLPVPEEYGGGNADPVTVAIGLEALGFACRDNGLIFSLNAQMWSCEMPIVTFGTEDQKRRYLPGLCDGSLIGVQGVTEPDSGSDAFSLTTTVERRGDEFVLNGRKTFVTNAPVADVFIIFATSDVTKGFGAVSAFIVDRDTAGLSVGRPFQKMGLHTSPMSELALTDCAVPATAVLGKVGAGLAVFSTAMDWERSFILAAAVGTMERQLQRSTAHARARRQFGRPIGKFQAVSHRIVEMKLRLKTSRLVLYEVAWLWSQGRATSSDAALAKLHLSECFVQSSLDALQLHGGYGYMAEYDFERDVRDSVASRIYSGTSEMQRNIVARHIGL